MTCLSTRREALLTVGAGLLFFTSPSLGEAAIGFDALFEEARGLGDLLADAAGQSEAEELLSSGFGAASLDVAKSERKISSRAMELIVFFEVSGRSQYEKKYRSAIWPGGMSGVTVGIGYDLGYVDASRISADWSSYVSGEQVKLLQSVAGLRSANAKAALSSVGRIDIPFDVAFQQFQREALPRYVTITEDALPNTSMLSDDSMGALVSLTYNRGASYTIGANKDSKGRYKEMRAIRGHMSSKNFGLIPAEIRNMVRLWDAAKFPGLHERRELEASLFEAGL